MPPVDVRATRDKQAVRHLWQRFGIGGGLQLELALDALHAADRGAPTEVLMDKVRARDVLHAYELERFVIHGARS